MSNVPQGRTISGRPVARSADRGECPSRPAAAGRTVGIGRRLTDRRLIGNNAHHIRAGLSPRVTTATTTTTETPATAKPTDPCPVRRLQHHRRRCPCGPSEYSLSGSLPLHGPGRLAVCPEILHCEATQAARAPR